MCSLKNGLLSDFGAEPNTDSREENSLAGKSTYFRQCTFFPRHIYIRPKNLRPKNRNVLGVWQAFRLEK